MSEQETDFVDPQVRRKVVRKIAGTPETQKDGPALVLIKRAGLDQQHTLLKRYFPFPY